MVAYIFRCQALNQEVADLSPIKTRHGVKKLFSSSAQALSSAEPEISTAHKYQNSRKILKLKVQNSKACNLSCL